MKLYNTLSRQLESYTADGTATIYVCGITPYDTTHLGHAFTYIANDILIRYLEYQGIPVTYVQNVTDIDDDILRKAKAVGDDWQTLGDRWTAHFIRDLIQLNVRPPDHFPRATDVIVEIIATVQALLTAGVAYESGGNVYFHVAAWDDFGKLSQIPRDQMLAIANQRGNFSDDPHKQHPLDFVLWQAQKPGEPAWDSPWGAGRPGWHIECSTLSSKFLGEQIDFHSGGGDLLFPHHECEIAQMESVTGKKPFVRFWLHVGMVRHDGEKMSKSLGNLVMARELLRTYTADALRLYLARHHYRMEWSYSEAGMMTAARLAAQLHKAATLTGGAGPVLDAAPFQADFETALNADLNSGGGVDVLVELAAAIRLAAEAEQDVRPAQATLRRLGQVLGLRLDATEPEARVTAGWQAHLQRFTAHEQQ